MRKIVILAMVFAAMGSSVCAQNLSDVKIYINPGHGGHDSDDRNMKIPAYGTGIAADFWESESNLDKGFHLRELLEAAGAKVFMSRVTNTTADDLPLSQIVRMANEAESDFMLSIHSNAGETANYVLQLYSGVDPNDTYVYPTATPRSEESRLISTIIAENQYSNKANVWGNNFAVRGDKTFARTAMQWSDGYGVLRGLTVPGTISEGSMHDYLPETCRLMNTDYKWLEAWQFFRAFCTYFKGGDPTWGNIVGTIHDSRNQNEAPYKKIAKSKDELLLLNGAKVTLQPGNQVYTTDNLNNGVYLFRNLAPGTYTVTFEMDGYYPYEQTLEVTASQATYHNAFLNKVRNSAPEVVAYSPAYQEEGTQCVSPVILDFNWDVDEISAINAFSITPAVEGIFSFEDSNHRMIFTPRAPYEVSTVYTVKVDKSLKHRGDMCMEEDFEFSFLTKDRNRLVTVAGYPLRKDETVHFEKPTFSFVFDRTLQTSVIKDNINVYDKDGNLQGKNSRSQLNNKEKEPYGSSTFQLGANLVAGEYYDFVIDSALIDTDGIPVYDKFVCRFKAADVRVTDKTVVQDFEQQNVIAYDAARSEKVTSASASRSSSKKLIGSYTYSFNYELSENAAGSVAYKYTGGEVSLSKGNVVGMHVYGDLSGNELQLELTGGEETRYVRLCTTDFFGWLFVETQLNDLEEGVTYNLSGFRVVQKEAPLNDRGVFYLDNMLVYNEPLTAIESVSISTLKVYPNPVSSILNVECEEAILEITLFTMDGKLLASCQGTTMDVSGQPAGQYILKVKCRTKEQYYPLLIARD